MRAPVHHNMGISNPKRSSGASVDSTSAGRGLRCQEHLGSQASRKPWQEGQQTTDNVTEATKEPISRAADDKDTRKAEEAGSAHTAHWADCVTLMQAKACCAWIHRSAGASARDVIGRRPAPVALPWRSNLSSSGTGAGSDSERSALGRLGVEAQQGAAGHCARCSGG